MPSPFVKTASVYQGSDCLLLARIRSIDGTYLQQSVVSAIALTVYDKANSLAVVVGPLALTVSSVVFNALQTSAVLWPGDSTGYNFLCRVAGAAAFPSPRVYRVDVVFALTDGTSFPVQFDLTAWPVP